MPLPACPARVNAGSGGTGNGVSSENRKRLIEGGKSVAAKKITNPAGFVKGLLKSVDQIPKLLNPSRMLPRVLLTKLRDEVELAD